MTLEQLAADANLSITSHDFATCLDNQDELKEFRQDFLFPKVTVGTTDRVEALYLCGNSLGIQPKRTKEVIIEQLDKWADQGVEGHFTDPTPWLTIDGMS